MQFHELHPSLPAWMSAFEVRLSAFFAGEYAVIHEAGVGVLGTRGKRIRPVMLLLSRAMFGDVDASALTQASLVELIHAASLVHDDVVDEADLRRGVPSARARWDNKFSILLGDLMLAKAFATATADGDARVLQVLAATSAEMARSVLLELSLLGLDAGEETYWQVIYGKTAALFGAAAAIGVLLGDASADQCRTMRRVGECFGYAFQLADDLLDLQGTDEEAGKPLRVDWRQQRATLPLLYAMRTSAPPAVAQIETLWQQEPFSEAHFFAIRQLVDASGGFEYGWKKVKEYLDEACAGLRHMPSGAGRDALRTLCQERFPLPVMPV